MDRWPAGFPVVGQVRGLGLMITADQADFAVDTLEECLNTLPRAL